MGDSNSSARGNTAGMNSANNGNGHDTSSLSHPSALNASIESQASSIINGNEQRHQQQQLLQLQQQQQQQGGSAPAIQAQQNAQLFHQHFMNPQFLRPFYSPTPPPVDLQNQLNDGMMSGSNGNANINLLQRAASPPNVDPYHQHQIQQMFAQQQQQNQQRPPSANPMLFSNPWPKQPQVPLYHPQQQGQLPYLFPDNPYLQMQPNMYQQMQLARSTPPLRTDDDENNTNAHGQPRYQHNLDMDQMALQSMPSIFQRSASPARNLPPPIIPNLNFAFNDESDADAANAAARGSSALNFTKGSLPASPSASSFVPSDTRFTANVVLSQPMSSSSASGATDDLFSHTSGLASPALLGLPIVNPPNKMDQHQNQQQGQTSYEAFLMSRAQGHPNQFQGVPNMNDYNIQDQHGSNHHGADETASMMASMAGMNNNGGNMRPWDNYNHMPLDVNQQPLWYPGKLSTDPNQLERFLTNLRSSSASPAFDLFGFQGFQHQQQFPLQPISSYTAKPQPPQTKEKKPVKRRKAASTGAPKVVMNPDGTMSEVAAAPKPQKRKRSEPGVMKHESMGESMANFDPNAPVTKRTAKIGANPGWKNDYATILSSLDRRTLLCVQSELSKILVTEVKVITRHANNSGVKRPMSARRLTVSIDKDGNEYVMRKVLPHRHKDITKSCVACAVRSMLNKANDILSGKLPSNSKSSGQNAGNDVNQFSQQDELSIVNDPALIEQSRKIIIDSIGLAHAVDMFSEEAAIKEFQDEM